MPNLLSYIYFIAFTVVCMIAVIKVYRRNNEANLVNLLHNNWDTINRYTFKYVKGNVVFYLTNPGEDNEILSYETIDCNGGKLNTTILHAYSYNNKHLTIRQLKQYIKNTI